MSYLVSPRVWTRQPQGVLTLDYSNPILKKPLLCEVGNLAVNLVTHRPPVKADTTNESRKVTRYGIATNFVGSTNAAHNYTGYPAVASTEITFAGVVTITNGGFFPGIASTSSGNAGFRIQQGASVIGITKGGVIDLATVAITANQPSVYFLSHHQGSGNYYGIVRNLVTGAITTVTANDTNISTASDGTFHTGIGRDDLTTSAAGDLYLTYIDARYRPFEIGMRFVKNPWQIFAPPLRRTMLDQIAAASAALRYQRALTGVGY